MPGLPVLAGPGFLRAVVPQYARKDVERDRRVGQLRAWGLCGRTPVQALLGAFAARAS
jgi:hypothetical protein